jgi:hypothetical protein
MAWHTHYKEVELTGFLCKHFRDNLNAFGIHAFRVDVERFKENRAAIKVILIDAEGEVARFTLESHPQCAGIADSIDTEVQEKHRNKKIAQFMTQVKCALAIHLGFSILLATVKTSNYIENHILLKNEWVKGETFLNDRTKNEVTLWTHKLKK